MQIFFLIFFYWNICNAQVDDVLNWEKILNEVFTTKQDSLKSWEYVKRKEPFFEQYYNSFSSETLDSLRNACHSILRSTNNDSTVFVQNVTDREYCWVMQRMDLIWSMKKIQRELDHYYDSKGDTVGLMFILDGEKILLEDNFNIYYLLDSGDSKYIINVKTCKNSFIAINLSENTTGMILLEFENNYYPIIISENLDVIKKEIRLLIFFETQPYTYFMNKDVPINEVQSYLVLKEAIKRAMSKKKEEQGFILVQKERFGVEHCEYFNSVESFFEKWRKVFLSYSQ